MLTAAKQQCCMLAAAEMMMRRPGKLRGALLKSFRGKSPQDGIRNSGETDLHSARP